MTGLPYTTTQYSSCGGSKTDIRPQASGRNAGVGTKRKSALSEEVTPRLSRAPVWRVKSSENGDKSGGKENVEK